MHSPDTSNLPKILKKGHVVTHPESKIKARITKIVERRSWVGPKISLAQLDSGGSFPIKHLIHIKDEQAKKGRKGLHEAKRVIEQRKPWSVGELISRTRALTALVTHSKY